MKLSTSAMDFIRSIQGQMEKWLFKKKVLILYGPRQVGKTTLSQILLKKDPSALHLNCERFPVRDILESQNPEKIKSFFGDSKIVLLDEAQKVEDIGLVLKLMIDTYPDLQIIATGSSSFDLANQINEPLTGRNIKFTLYPLSLAEIEAKKGPFFIEENMERYLRFGLYPEIVKEASEEALRIRLEMLASDYLYRDVLEFEQLKRSDLLFNLLKALALQLGSEVSLNELANLLNTSVRSIERYIHLLEQSFVIFRLTSFSQNLRKEIARKNKIYFYDLGIRNAVIQNFLPLDSRQDKAALWENFCLMERIKYNQRFQRNVNRYFWRTYDQKEIDYIEEVDGKLHAFEFKWKQSKKTKVPKLFTQTYPQSEFKVVTRQDYRFFMMDYTPTLKQFLKM